MIDLEENNWTKAKSEDILKILNSDIEGLNDKEVEQKTKEHGYNRIPKTKKDSLVQLFFKQFADSIIIVLIVVTIISFIIGEFIDGFAILFIILLDAFLGTLQEWNAAKNAESLKDLIKVKTLVRRNNKEIELDAEELVPGDIIILSSGVKIPADARILSSNNLTVNEASLTGESTASIKHNKVITGYVSIMEMSNMLFAGTSVITGRAEAVVVETGINTQIGKIAQEVDNVEEQKSPLTIRINKFSKQISVFIVILSLFIIILLFAKNHPTDVIFLSVIALAVSAMPEGLPLALTMALSIGSNRMAKKNIIVKKLNSVESLGSCTVIASDKTGTLTVNEQTAKEIILPDDTTYKISGSGYNDDGVINNQNNSALEIAKLGMLNNEANLTKDNNLWTYNGDSIDIAFLALGKKAKTDISNINILAEIPYESEIMYSAVFYEENNKKYCSVKGSLETVFEMCDSMNVDNKNIKINIGKLREQNEKLASEGYRIIALAKGKVENFETKNIYAKKDIPKLTFMGLVAFIDPIRKEAASAIEKCNVAGIKTVIITGDHPLTSYSIGKKLNLVSNFDEVTNGKEVEEYLNKSTKDFDVFVRSKKVFARITPIQKLKIVEAYKRMGEFVAVTGDGINDAPALKVANIGISMGSGTDVAKETSQMIITDNNFLSIVSGVEEGRVAYANIRKVIYMLVSCGIAEVFFFLLAIAFNYPMPLVATQLLWLNLATDGLQDLALSFEKAEENIMEEKPRNPKAPIFDRLLISELLISSLFIGILVFIVWVILMDFLHFDVYVARGYILALMVLIQNMHVLNCRSEKTSAFKMPIKNNRLVIFSIAGALLLQVLVMNIPILRTFLQATKIPFNHLLILFVLSLPILLIMETFKKIYFKKE